MAVIPIAAFATCTPDDRGSWLSSYEGTIGASYKVRMTLAIAGKEVKGKYIYLTQLKDIQILGRIDKGAGIVLDELDSTGRVVARFQGNFPERDPRGSFGGAKLNCEVIIGSWQKQNSTQSLPVYLTLDGEVPGTLANRYAVAGAKDDELINRSAQSFQDAVKRRDEGTVAAMVDYPIAVRIGGNTKRIRGPKELIANYDAIFSPKYREAIANAFPRDMFARDQGVMLGSGAVWFDARGRVIALNNE